MNDRELLELASRAAGLKYSVWSDKIKDYDSPHYGGPALHADTPYGEYDSWNPLTDDGDALRLAVKLDIHIEQNTPFKRACALWYGSRILREELFESWGNDKQAATRRAITRAAAAIGSAMQQTEVK